MSAPEDTRHHDTEHEPERPARRLRPVDPDGPPPVWTPELWSAQRLMSTDFPTPKWAVPGVLCEGVSLLAGPPKVGKSWLALDLGICVASGGDAFGRIPVRQGPVLYLALEDTPRRLKTRVQMLLRGGDPPPGLDIATEWPAMPDGGALALGRWLQAHPNARMVVIDVFAKVRGISPMGTSAYDADYAAVGWIKRVADHFGVAVLVVHHVRKAANEDFLQEVSGTNGIAGAADATLVLRRPRGQADGALHVTGRDVEETELALSRDPDSGSWRMLDGAPADLALGETRARILRHVRDHGPMAPAQVAAGLNLAPDTVRQTMSRMHKASQLIAQNGGRYTAPLEGQDALA